MRRQCHGSQGKGEVQEEQSSQQCPELLRFEQDRERFLSAISWIYGLDHQPCEHCFSRKVGVEVRFQ